MELLMLCHVFSFEEPGFFRAPLHRVFVCKKHVFPPLNSGGALRKGTSMPRISLMAGGIIIDRLMLEEFIDGVHNDISTLRAPVTI